MGIRDDIGALGPSLSEDVAAAVDAMVETRRDLHAHPELAHREERTQGVVMDRLGKAGIEARPIAGTGVLGRLDGAEPGPVLLLRADMDALPIQEESSAPYRSRNDGAMHACGHDAHTAALLATAEILASRGLARGSVKLLFQPAEEGGGGAAAAIDDGALEDPAVDAALAFHVWSGLPVGTVAAPDGPVMASVDGFSMRIDGRGAHAATPEEGIDPVPIAAQIVTAAQTAITRRKAARDPAVLSFTAIRAGEAFNVIPSRVDVKGTIRAFAPEVRALVKAELVRIGRGVAEAMGARASFDFFEGLGPTVNDPAVAAAARAIAAEVVGAERIADHPPLMVGEDMGLLLARVPGAMVLLGAADPSGKGAYPHHHPLFDIDERVLPIGVEIATRFAERFVAG